MNKNLSKTKKPLVLLVLDGFGIAPKSDANAIELAKKPNYDALLKKYSHTELVAHGREVGLPADQPGNSEAGHMNIGAGRVVDQDSVYISKAISTGKFFKNPAFEAAYVHTQKNNSDLHLMGMLSDGGSAHSDPDHLLALLSWTRKKKIKNVYLHIFTDGRDSVPHGALKMVEALMRSLKNKETKNGVRTGEWIATIMGRFYAMDRKKEWSRTEAAYDAMVMAKGIKIKSPQAAITQSYNRGETDEFIRPYVICRQDKPIAKIKDKDAIIFFNLRSDRARQLAKSFVQDGFNELNPGSFKRKKVLKDILFTAMTDFGPDLGAILTAFPSEDITGTLPMVLKDRKQLYIAEKEKYAHVTYFFNGGYADPVNGEDRVVLDSPPVDSYDQVPEMSTRKITSRVLKSLDSYDFIVINFAAADMIAHTGNIQACIKAVEAIDESIGKIAAAVLKRNGIFIITADHGNAEKMLDLETREMYTEHTTNPVPFILIEKSDKKRKLKKGKLGDIAPTILKLLNAKKPKEMTGKSLI
ncbi:MAG: 2,3-bisphosphoglycerate-independent phosphoglycerate mutase [Candidatus Buchananbacteria bacterium]|nr:2,3-bisphosphoglycerate-independent phosphoglycerate mutase [Candidatus Buchananbacteria bacterium]